jgi:polygalacturonase
VELTTGSGGANAFLVGPISLTSNQTLVIDQGVTVYASRNPKSYGTNCVVIDPSGAVSDTSVAADAMYDCGAVILATGDHVSVMGQGTIDGQGGEPLIGVSPPTNDIDTVANPTVPAGSFSWWNVSDFERHDSRAMGSGPGSAPNPALVRVSNATNFVLFGLNLYNSAFFHIQLNSDKFVVWANNLNTPTNKTSSAGQALSNFVARNTDGIDPGAASGVTQNGYIVGNRVSVGDDMVAIKGNAQGGANNLVIAHNHFGTGHGMSLGSATMKGITNVHVYDMTIDGDVPVDTNTGSSDLNGLRIKSYTGAGGFVHNILFENVCTRDEVFPIDITASYTANPIVDPAGVPPDFQNITVTNFHQVNVNGPQHATQVQVLVEGDSTHQATVAFNNVYVETSTGKKGGPVLTVKSTATLTGTMNIGVPPSNDPCTGATWWPAAPTVP